MSLYSGAVIKKVLVVAKEGPSESLLLTVKPSLVEAVEANKDDGAFPASVAELKAGTEHAGYIRSVTSYGCFVGLLHGVVGLVRKGDLAHRFVEDAKVRCVLSIVMCS